LLLGRVAVDVSALQKLGNVIFPGPQPYGDLPSWAKAFDVAIYPGGQNEFVRNANPLKIREYLATGKPVVSVSSREVERFRGVVRIANTQEEFLREIDDALANDTAAAREERLKMVSTMSWDARVDEVMARVEATMSGQ
jgi:glycosyltransferase involved in cell wall biosynthesis